MTQRVGILIAAVALCSVLLALAAASIFCRLALQRHPHLSQRPANAATVTVRVGDGASLSAWWIRASNPNGNCVAVLHGIGDSRAGTQVFAPMFLTEGYSVLLPDSRAHGASEGQFVTYGLLEKYDVMGWAMWMRQAGCRKIYGLGESLGASILIQSAGLQPVFAAIVAESPYADLREIAEYRVRRMGHLPPLVARLVVGSALVYAGLADGLNLRDVSPVQSIARASTPILLIHGLLDIRTPPYNSQRLAQANPHDPPWLVPNARHTAASSADPTEFRKRVLAWFAEH